MTNYYRNLIEKQLEKDIIKDLVSENSDNKELILQEICSYFENNEITFVEYNTSSDTHKTRDRDAYKNKENRCIARIWNEGFGGQCSCSGKKEYSNYCKTHFNKSNNWWLGIFDGPRPERPVNSTGKIHYWLS